MARTNCVKLTSLARNLAEQAVIIATNPENCGHPSQVWSLPISGPDPQVSNYVEVRIMNAFLTAATQPFNTESFKPGGAIWNSLQELKEMTSRELLDDGPVCNQPVEGFSADLNDREIGFRRRSLLEQRLMEITNAQDRLMDERYGRCSECQEEINPRRLAADPAASLCLDCQKLADGERRFPTM